jgi:hypothetical protein
MGGIFIVAPVMTEETLDPREMITDQRNRLVEARRFL